MQGPMRSGILETYIYTLAYSATPVRTVLYYFLRRTHAEQRKNRRFHFFLFFF